MASIIVVCGDVMFDGWFIFTDFWRQLTVTGIGQTTEESSTTQAKHS